MKFDIFNTNKANLLKNGLNVYTKQVQNNAKNIANIDNPTYNRAKTDFSDELVAAKEKARLKATNNKHILKPHYQPKMGIKERSKNEVDLNKEMSQLAENQIRYNFASRVIRKHYAGLKKSISGRI